MICLKASLFLCIFATFNGVNGNKVDTKVLHEINQGHKPNVIVACQKSETQRIDSILKEISEASQNAETTRSDVLTKLVQQQQNTVLNSVEKVTRVLRKLKAKFKVLWISNEIFVRRATADVIRELGKMQVVVGIRTDQVVSLVAPKRPESQPELKANQPWNLASIDARCEGIKCLGKGVTLGFIDTGVLATHVEIKDNWLGKDTRFGYLDGFNYSCNPEDLYGLGTHVVGTAVGKSVGVAPEAKWMMCLACAADGCYESALKNCAEWLSCPYACGDETEDTSTKNCTMRPHVINNSWYFTIATFVYPEYFYYFFYEYIEYWNKLGIISIFAAGDKGPGCSTVGYPAGYDNVIDVGSTNENFTLSEFSSVGPVLSTKPLTAASIAFGSCSATSCGNHNKTCGLIKPTIVAPGQSIRSAGYDNDTAFKTFSGTDVGTPHVTGVVALMICSNRTAKWNYKLAYEILTTSTNTSRIDLLGERQNKDNPTVISTNLRCNVMMSKICNTFPNNLYGYGLVNACKAVAKTKKLLSGL